MADFYVKNGTGGTDDGSNWTNAAESIKDICDALGYQALAAGDIIYVDEGHQETYTVSTLFIFPTTISNPVKVVIVTTGTINAVTSVTATVTITTTVSNNDIKFSGAVYFWGIRMQSEQDFEDSGAGAFITLEKSCLQSGTSDSILSAAFADGNMFRLIDTDLQEVSMYLNLGGHIEWIRGTWIDNSAHIIDWFIRRGHEAGVFYGRGLDLSAYTGTYVLQQETLTHQTLPTSLIRCKMWSGWVATSGDLVRPTPDSQVKMESCDTGDGYYFFTYPYYGGSVVQDTGIYRTGGNSFTAKMVTLATGVQEYISPIRHKVIAQYIDISTEKTLKVHFTYDSATVLNDDDMWLEIDYNNVTDEALGDFVTTKAATPTTTPGRTPFTDVSGSETWTGTSGFTNPQEETLEKAITGGAGIVTVWACLAKPSMTVYVDPDVAIS